MFEPRKSDGYHPLQSVFQTIDFGDTLVVDTHNEPGLSISHTGVSIPGTGPNILDRIHAHYATTLKHGYRVTLHKEIPVGAGLGGGSSNAATFLKALNEHEGWGWSAEELESQGLQFGADVPFFVKGGTQLAEGVGDRLTALERGNDSHYLLINPQVHSNTAEVYAAYDAAKRFPQLGPVPSWMRSEHVGDNSLWPVVRARIPELQELEVWLVAQGAPELHLSGSGATVFLICSTQKEATKWCQRVQEKYPNFWVKPSRPY